MHALVLSEQKHLRIPVSSRLSYQAVSPKRWAGHRERSMAVCAELVACYGQ